MSLPSLLRDRLRLPVVGSPLFIVSTPDLVIAQCKAGIVGSFPALNARPKELLDRWLRQITEELAEFDRQHPERPSAPFAVNQIIHRSNDRLDHDVALCLQYKVPITITSLGARPDLNDAVHSYGGIVLHDVISNSFARKAIAKGADGLIAVAAGAGGHAGVQSPFALVEEIRQWFDGPLLLGGAISTGQAILAAQVIGADLAYIGSPFIATAEANAADDYKQMIIEADAEEIVYSSLFTGVSGNYLKGSVRRAGLDPDKLPPGDIKTMSFGSDPGIKVWKDIWGCGQGIGAVKSVLPVCDVVSRLQAEYQHAVDLTAIKASRRFKSDSCPTAESP